MATVTATVTFTVPAASAASASNYDSGGGGGGGGGNKEAAEAMWHAVVTEEMQKRENVTALVALATADRNTSMASIEENVQKALSDPTTAARLVELICHVRNHGKSQASRQGVGITGAGERAAAERMMLALYKVDPDAAIAVSSLMPFYGSWNSVVHLMCEATTAPVTAGVDWARFAAHLYDVYAEQIKADQVAAAAGNPVSNASKFAPHEKRKGIPSIHGDEIARRVFSGTAVPAKGSAGQKSLRRRWRKLRVQLNAANAHIAEKYLSEKQAGRLDTRQITAGALATMRKALLNLTKKNTERTSDPGRRALRRKLEVMLAKEKPNVVVPSNLQQMADTLLKVDETTDDAVEVRLLTAGYKALVRDVATKVKQHIQRATTLAGQLSDGRGGCGGGGGGSKTDPLGEAAAKLAAALAHDPTRCAIAIDATASQTGMIPTASLLSLVLADVELAIAKEKRGGDEDFDDEPTSKVVLFSRTAQAVEIPAGTIANPPHRRLKLLYDAAQTLATSRAGDFGRGGKAGKADYGSMFRALSDDAAFANRHIIVASDFSDVPGFVGAVEVWRAEAAGNALATGATVDEAAAGAAAAEGRLVTAWRMTAPIGKTGKKRTRLPTFDRSNPRMDVVFVMDTTGSMGIWIKYASQQAVKMIKGLAAQNGIKARAAFVSYKDFGDPGHPTMTTWCDMEKTAHKARMNSFIARLGPSGGGDMPEDVATGLEQAEKLFVQSQNCIKVVVLIADAPAHGMYSNGINTHYNKADSWPTRNGVNQRERTLKAVDRLARQGVEMLFAQCTSGGAGLGLMTKLFDEQLRTHGTFLDAFSISGASNVFTEKIGTAINSLVSQAIAPPDTEGLDIVSGTDAGMPVQLVNQRFSEAMREALDLVPAETGKLEKKKASETRAPTVYERLAVKLADPTYDPVRLALSGTASGMFAGYRWAQALEDHTIQALVSAGVTPALMKERNYPDMVVDQFTRAIKLMAAR